MRFGIILCAIALAGVSLAFAMPTQDGMGGMGADEMKAQMEMMAKYQAYATPGEEHQAMLKYVGDWKLKVDMSMGPGGPTMTSYSTATIASAMGGRYITETVSGDMMGQPFEGMSITGFNNVTKEWEGVWFDNHGTGLTYNLGEGEFGSAMVWKSKGTDPLTGTHKSARSVHKWISDDEMLYEMYDSVGGSEEFKAMTITYTRKTRG